MNLYFQQQTSSRNIENAKLQSLINNVKDLLPHLGDGFIQVNKFIFINLVILLDI